MRKPQGYDEAEAYTGEYNGPGPLPAGLYVCKIMHAVEETKNGKRFLVIGFDIVEGDYAGYYKAPMIWTPERIRNGAGNIIRALRRRMVLVMNGLRA